MVARPRVAAAAKAKGAFLMDILLSLKTFAKHIRVKFVAISVGFQGPFRLI